MKLYQGYAYILPYVTLDKMLYSDASLLSKYDIKPFCIWDLIYKYYICGAHTSNAVHKMTEHCTVTTITWKV